MKTSLMLVAAAGFLAACAIGPKMPTSLEDRVQARWDALVAGDLETAYAYFSPGYRASTSLAQFQKKMQRRALRWTGASYKSKDCEDDRCRVVVDVDYHLYAPTVGHHRSTRGVSETWLKVDGEWYFIPKK